MCRLLCPSWPSLPLWLAQQSRRRRGELLRPATNPWPTIPANGKTKVTLMPHDILSHNDEAQKAKRNECGVVFTATLACRRTMRQMEHQGGGKEGAYYYGGIQKLTSILENIQRASFFLTFRLKSYCPLGDIQESFMRGYLLRIPIEDLKVPLKSLQSSN